MGGVGDESPLADEREIESVQHVVERVGQLLEFIVWPVVFDPLIEMFLRGAPRGTGDFVQRAQDPASDHPPQRSSDHGTADETDQRPQQELMKVVVSLVDGARLGSAGEGFLALAS